MDIDLRTVKLMIFTDGSFTGNKNLFSQISYVATLVNEISKNDATFTIRTNVIYWSFIKYKKIVTNSIGAEMFSVVTIVDIGVAISTIFERITDRLELPKIPFVLYTDFQSFYDTINGLNTIQKKRLIIELMAFRKSYENRKIEKIL